MLLLHIEVSVWVVSVVWCVVLPCSTSQSTPTNLPVHTHQASAHTYSMQAKCTWCGCDAMSLAHHIVSHHIDAMSPAHHIVSRLHSLSSAMPPHSLWFACYYCVEAFGLTASCTPCCTPGIARHANETIHHDLIKHALIDDELIAHIKGGHRD